MFAVFLLVLGVADAACCKNALTYTVTNPNGDFNYQFVSNYAGDSLSNGLNASIAVVAGCPVTFTISVDSVHPFDVQFVANGSQVSGFNQGQVAATATWNVPAGMASTSVYKYQCENHPNMHNNIRVLDDCIMDMTKDCDTYCMNVSTVCTGSNGQFPNPDDAHGLCMASCMYYPDNSTASMSGDSYQCRVYQLGRASSASGSSKTSFCNAAGFNGGAGSCVTCAGMCGSFCDAYCDQMMSGCVANNTVFTDRAACMRECQWYPRNSAFNLSDPGLAVNNSVDCRSWHVQVAVNSSASDANNRAHCGHASPQGGSVCGTGCENFCDMDMNVCMGGLKQWNDRTQCLKACMTWPQQTYVSYVNNTVTSGNSLPCRKYHASVAGQSSSLANAHCVHTGPLGGYGVCGSECEGLCNIAVMACGLDANTCASMCTSLNTSAGNTTTTILAANVPKGSVGCATYWALKALQTPALCDKLNDYLVPAAGGVCDSSMAPLVKASWSIIAVILLALGFNS